MLTRRRSRGSWKAENGSFAFRLVLLAVFFSAGIFLGQVLSAHVQSGTADELTHYLESYFSLSQTRSYSLKTVLSTLLIYFRYPVLAFLCGFASLGIVLLPALTIAYGFFFSFSVCCFTAVFGSRGVLLALSIFGLRCLVTLPCYFYLAIPSLQSAFSLASFSFGRGKRVQPVHFGSVWWFRLGVVSLILLAGTAAELFLVPRFLHWALSGILA